jgi:acyl-CoA synthetase (AMP-forming)/AMP-acid ligase II
MVDNNPEGNSPEISDLGALVSVNARCYGDRTAVAYAERRVSFLELEQRANRVANGLVAEGVASQARVAVLDRNAETFFDILFGTALANAVLVTINFRLAPPEIEYILADSDTELLFIGADFQPLVDDLRQRLPALKRIIVLSDEEVSEFDEWCGGQDSETPQRAIDPASGAVQMYTSGTTGNPKGVELSHRAMVNAACAGLGVWPFLFEDDSAVLGTMPLFHIAACNLCIAALYAGARADILREATPAQLADIIPAQGISLVPLPAAVIHAMLRLDGIEQKDFSSLQVMLVAGSGIAVELLREAGRVFDCGFALSYGATEMCGGVSYLGPGECVHDGGKRLESAGRVLPHSEVHILDEQGVELPAGVIGEVVTRSDRLMTKYWNRPQATAEALREGWFYSGDAGYMDEDGYLFIVDRLKDMVISGGENVYPSEIEQVMHTHPAIEDVAVVGIPDEKWGETLLAFVILKSEAAVDAYTLEEYLRTRLAGFKVPRRYEFVDEFPRNATGKVLKRSLREPYWRDKNRQVG